MREIKFRAKRIDTGEWITGDLIKGIYKDYAYIICPTFHNKEREFLEVNGAHSVDPETVGQFMGLLAKGKELYEGDIYRHNGTSFVVINSTNMGFCSVEMNKHYTVGMDTIKNENNRRDYWDIHGIQKYIEIIGTIHDKKA